MLYYDLVFLFKGNSASIPMTATISGTAVFATDGWSDQNHSYRFSYWKGPTTTTGTSKLVQVSDTSNPIQIPSTVGKIVRIVPVINNAYNKTITFNKQTITINASSNKDLSTSAVAFFNGLPRNTNIVAESISSYTDTFTGSIGTPGPLTYSTYPGFDEITTSASATKTWTAHDSFTATLTLRLYYASGIYVDNHQITEIYVDNKKVSSIFIDNHKIDL